MASFQFVRSRNRSFRMTGASLIALSVMATSPALAQQTAAAPPAEDALQVGDSTLSSQAAPGNDIVVTGSRVARRGYTAPTPTSVLDSSQLNAIAPANIADAVNTLPAFAASTTPRSVTNVTSGGVAGANLLNLRNLGVNRTLVLLDGRRVAPSTVTGAVDINLLPSALVNRVEVVTGGASAAYGSDAVAGVVNFILNDRLNGVQGSVQTGITEAGDGRSYKADLSYGGHFLDDRLHVLVSGSIEDVGSAGPASSRNWYGGSKLIANPAYVAGNGQPRLTVLPGVGISNASPGGLITAGPLRGTQFLPGGVPAPFNFGTASGNVSVGGSAYDDGQYNQLQAPVNNKTVFGRLAYDITSDIQLFAEASYGRSQSDYYTVPYYRLGNITIRNDNAYLDAATKARMAAAGITSFTMGRTNRDIGVLQGLNRRELQRYVGGVKGSIAGGWTWDGYFQHGETRILNQLGQDPIVANYLLAADAVRSSSGQIVCRSTLTNPGNGCVPVNLFGEGSPSDAARTYILGTASQGIKLKQDVADFSIQGEPFSIWGAPVSIAAGGEYRHESYAATADTLSLTNAYFAGNYKPSSGKQTVKEGFFETVIPLLRGLPGAKAVDFNGAVRVTDYSISGTVATWKAGLTWDVFEGLRLRGTRSRDIRAPNLNDLFQGGQSNSVTIADPTNSSSALVQRTIVGNQSLVPEKADTVSGGIVLQPSFLPGFSASVDYFRIKINDAIVVLDPQDVLNRCLAGNSDLCQYIRRNTSGTLVQILTPALNVQAEKTSGIDIEANYRLPLERLWKSLPGTLTLNAVGTWIDERSVNTGATTLDYAGSLADATAVPDWRWLLSASYSNAGFSTTLRGRYIGSGNLRNEYTAADIVDNHVPSVFYVDLSASQSVPLGGDRKVELFLSVENLLDKAPPATPATIGNLYVSTGVNALIYDTLGRQFRTGVRFKF